MFIIFFFNDTATTEIYTLSLHDALPISADLHRGGHGVTRAPASWTLPAPLRASASGRRIRPGRDRAPPDRKSTRLNSSHANISYAVFCLKKNKRRTTAR